MFSRKICLDNAFLSMKLHVVDVLTANSLCKSDYMESYSFLLHTQNIRSPYHLILAYDYRKTAMVDTICLSNVAIKTFRYWL